MKTLLPLTGAGLALLAAIPAFAAETYPGAMCESDSGGTRDVDGYGNVENESSTSTLYLVCPIVADPTVTSSSANVWVRDQHYSSNVCCDARYSNAGGSWLASADDCSSGSSSSYQTLSPVEAAYGYTFTHRFFYCDVPATYSGNISEVLTYRH